MVSISSWLRSPREAFGIYSAEGYYPRLRNTFMVRFIQGVNASLSDLTFGVKSVDRPKVNPKTEQLNQYNKCRHVFTGYKLEPIRIEFYDSANGAAQRMWTNYARYYFSDFEENSHQSYAYDATTPNFNDNTGKGFGFTGNQSDHDDPADQWYFDKIQIFHFYDDMYDQYDLIHPRITNYDPDQLDYENSAVALIHITFVYENLQYYQQKKTSESVTFSEFSSHFDGQTTSVPNIPQYTHTTATNTTNDSLTDVTQPPIGRVLSNSLSMTPSTASSGGVLNSYGHFNFGPLVSGSSNAIGMADITTAQAQAAIPGSSASSPDRSTTDPITGTLAEGLLTTANMGVANFRDIARSTIPSQDGVVYSPEVYGAINSQRTGTAQYGYNGPWLGV